MIIVRRVAQEHIIGVPCLRYLNLGFRVEISFADSCIWSSQLPLTYMLFVLHRAFNPRTSRTHSLNNLPRSSRSHELSHRSFSLHSKGSKDTLLPPIRSLPSQPRPIKTALLPSEQTTTYLQTTSHPLLSGRPPFL